MNLMYLVAERLAGQTKLSSTDFHRNMAHLLSSTGFGPAYDPGRQTSLFIYLDIRWGTFLFIWLLIDITQRSSEQVLKMLLNPHSIKSLKKPSGVVYLEETS